MQKGVFRTNIFLPQASLKSHSKGQHDSEISTSGCPLWDFKTDLILPFPHPER